MFRLWSWTVALTALGLVACNRNGAGSVSKISIRAPNRLKASIPTDRVACYAINVTSSGIPQSGSSCGIPSGITTNFSTLDADSTIETSVPRNLTIKVDLYLYLEPTGQNVPCPTWAAAMSAANLANVYWVGSDTKTTANDTIDADITVNYTGQNVAATVPAACTAASNAIPTPFSVNAGGASLTSTVNGYHMGARVNFHGGTLTSANGYKLITK